MLMLQKKSMTMHSNVRIIKRCLKEYRYYLEMTLTDLSL